MNKRTAWHTVLMRAAVFFRGVAITMGLKSHVRFDGKRSWIARPYALRYCLAVGLLLAGFVAHANEVVRLKLVNTAGVAQNDVMTTFGHVFKPGDVPANATLSAQLSSGEPVPLQLNAEARHADGSLRHGILTTQIDRLGAGQETLILKTNAPIPDSDHVSVSSLLSSEFNAMVTLILQGQRYTQSARDLLQNGSCCISQITTLARKPWARERSMFGLKGSWP